MDSRQFQNALDSLAVTRTSYEQFIDEVLTCVIEECFDRDHFACWISSAARARVRNVGKSLTRVAQMRHILKMLVKCLPFKAVAYNEYIARVLTALEPSIKSQTVDQPSYAERHRYQSKGGQDDPAGNVFGFDQVKRVCKQQACDETGLYTQLL